MKDRRRISLISTASFIFMMTGVFLLIVSTAGFLTSIIDMQVPDHTHEDFVHTGRGIKGEEYVLEARGSMMGSMIISITHAEGKDGWVWIKVWEGKRTALKMTNATLPYTGTAELMGGADVKMIIYCADPSADFEDIEVEMTLPGAAGLGGILFGSCFTVPCCGAWIASLILALLGIAGSIKHRRVREMPKEAE